MDENQTPENQALHFTPRARPQHRIFHGGYGRLEPVDPFRHTAELFAAAKGSGGEQSWAYLPYGPFDTEDHLADRLTECEATEDPLFFTIRDLDTGKACGMAAFMRINEVMGVVEIGHIWMAPCLQRTRAGTEAIFMMMDHVMTDLGYRRLEWKCNAANAVSRSAATRFGFTYEGTFRQHMIVKGKNRDTAWFSILDGEWLEQRRKFVNWLATDNFGAGARQRRRLQDCG